PHQGAGGEGELAGEVADPAGRTVNQYLAPEQEAALTQRVQRGQPRDRQCRGLRIAASLRQDTDCMAAAIDPLGPGAGRQYADHSAANRRAAAVGGSAFDDTGKIPARAPAWFGDLQGAPGLAAIKRDRCDPDNDLVTVGVAQFDR